MATIVSWNGSSFTVPETGEENWGGTTKVDGLLVSLAQNGFNKAGGLFTLSSDVDFGVTAGLVSQYYKSRGTVSTAGVLRLAKTESIGWRNNAASGNNLLTTDTSDNLTWNGTIIASSAGVVPVAAGGTGITSYTAGDMITATGATTLSKLAIGSANKVLTTNGSAPSWNLLVNANIDPAAAIAYSKLALTGAILNADINASAAIAVSKLAALTTSKAVATDGSGFLTTVAVTSTELGFVAGLTSSAVGTTQTQSLSGKTFTDSPILTQIATPSTPSAGLNKLYTKSGNTLVWLDSSGTEHVAMETAGSHYNLRNFIINGAFDFWQRGTSFAAIADGSYHADRWAYFKTTTGAVHTVSRDSSVVPTLAQSGFNSSYSLKAACTTADAAVGAGDIAYLRYAIEGYEWAQLKNLAVTLTFWVYSTKTGTSCVAFRNNGNDRSYVVEYTISSTLTWEKKTVTLTLNPSGGTDDFTTAAGLKISWPLICGSTFQTTANAWQTGNFHGTSNQINHCDANTNVFQLAQVQLTIGSTAPSTFNRAGGLIQAELELCRRYYQKSYDIATDPGNTTATGSISFRANGTSHIQPVPFPVQLRATPTIVLYATGSGTSGSWRDGTAGADRTATAGNTGINNMQVAITSSVDQNGMTGHWTADAEVS